jgi:hypothetical protein
MHLVLLEFPLDQGKLLKVRLQLLLQVLYGVVGLAKLPLEVVAVDLGAPDSLGVLVVLRLGLFAAAEEHFLVPFYLSNLGLVFRLDLGQFAFKSLSFLFHPLELGIFFSALGLEGVRFLSGLSFPFLEVLQS